MGKKINLVLQDMTKNHKHNIPHKRFKQILQNTLKIRDYDR